MLTPHRVLNLDGSSTSNHEHDYSFGTPCVSQPRSEYIVTKALNIIILIVVISVFGIKAALLMLVGHYTALVVINVIRRVAFTTPRPARSAKPTPHRVVPRARRIAK